MIRSNLGLNFLFNAQKNNLNATDRKLANPQSAYSSWHTLSAGDNIHFSKTDKISSLTFGHSPAVISPTTEMELKGLLSGRDDFERIKRYFNHPRYEVFGRVNGGLCSVYFDTPDNKLYQEGYCLRIRKNLDDEYYNDISIKTPVAGNCDSLYRKEYEATQPHIVLNLEKLRKIGPDAAEAVERILTLCDHDLDNHLKEKFYSNCYRSRFRVVLYVSQGLDGGINITPDRSGEAPPPKSKIAVFEAALDSTTFFVQRPGRRGKRIGADREIEWELKQNGAHEREEQVIYSSVDLTDKEARAGISYLKAQTEIALGNHPPNWEGKSKQSRGFDYLERYLRSHSIPTPALLTHLGSRLGTVVFGQSKPQKQPGLQFIA